MGEVEVDRPVSGMVASLSPGVVAVRQLVPPFETYTSPTDGSFTRRAREKRGLIFGATHLVDPSSPVTGDQMNMLMLTGTVLLGWVSLR